MEIAILYQDEQLVAVHKPSGLLVHRSPLSRDRVYLLQTLRDQLGRRLYPVHRLDRATSGVLVFAFDAETAHALNQAFTEQRVEKTYLAIVRGWPEPPEGHIDRPVRDDDREAHREAASDYRRLATATLPVANRRYPTSRYALVGLWPKTGRRHQLRIHMERISYPIIGDTTHGDGEHNRIFREHLGLDRLMLHALSLRLPHPAEPDQILDLRAQPGDQFALALERLGMAEISEIFCGKILEWESASGAKQANHIREGRT
ncbi:pseudouridine synthase [Gammaproteobacteria bacterium AB-CW1]|uniref:tRNA pseudouridine synthase C n=1 Tax=Natronospira elongata TaxID=3110268 RepID=A0AAP6JFF4_9GAMM|nr:pseudouridine synthase [Gammaproteobacteria bacterium AB-CW1]